MVCEAGECCESYFFVFLEEWHAERDGQPSQPQEQDDLPFRLRIIMTAITAITAAAKITVSIISVGFITGSFLQRIPHAMHIRYAASEAAHATAHCHTTTAKAHFLPSSRLIEAIAATQGV